MPSTDPQPSSDLVAAALAAEQSDGRVVSEFVIVTNLVDLDTGDSEVHLVAATAMLKSHIVGLLELAGLLARFGHDEEV